MADPDARDALALARRTGLADLAWAAGAGESARPCVRGVLPLIDPARPGSVTVALKYAELADARSLARAAGGEALLVLPDDAGAGRTVLRCRVSVAEDREGTVFDGDLLDQVLRRWPPSRVLADSPLLRREHWWYLPRLLVRLQPVAVERLAAGQGADHLLVTMSGRGLQAVGVARPEDLTIEARGSFDVAAPPAPPGTPADGAAMLHGHAQSPDRERWSQWSWIGHWDAPTLHAMDARGTLGLGPVPGVLARWRTQRRLEKACRAGLASVEARGL